ncbi:Uncharacterised protein [Mycobacteroides abscessus subsp. abscessus]|nr:Uncharacterised protein [Mycobacteroides abscessus subsp. abscessus]
MRSETGAAVWLNSAALAATRSASRFPGLYWGRGATSKLSGSASLTGGTPVSTSTTWRCKISVRARVLGSKVSRIADWVRSGSGPLCSGR